MKKWWQCRKFWRLYNERDWRTLTAQEESFLDEALSEYPELLDELDGASRAMNALRGCNLNLAPSEDFDDLVVGFAQEQQPYSKLSYWSPALVGGALASLAVLAVLQLLASSLNTNSAQVPLGSEAKINNSRLIFPTSAPELR